MEDGGYILLAACPGCSSRLFAGSEKMGSVVKIYDLHCGTEFRVGKEA